MNEVRKPMLGIKVEPALKQALADEAWRRRTTSSKLAREILVDGLRQRGVDVRFDVVEASRA